MHIAITREYECTYVMATKIRMLSCKDDGQTNIYFITKILNICQYEQQQDSSLTIYHPG
jgi:hypothetical protein